MKAKPRSAGEWVMTGALIVCLVAGLVAPFMGDDPVAMALPFAMAVFIAAGIKWVRTSGRSRR